MRNPSSVPTEYSLFPFELDEFQKRAIELIREGRSVLISAPTGTGKTVIADYIIHEAIRSERRVIYTSPIKALSNQKYRDYTRRYGLEKIGLVTGDFVINREAAVLIMTTEILRNMLLYGERIEGLSTVIFDEIHFIDDEERGTVWEETLIYLPPSVRIVGLSATISNLDEFARWLERVRGERVYPILETKRAVPLHFFLFNRWSGLKELKDFGISLQVKRRRQFFRKTSHLELVFRLDKRFFPLLYFVFNREKTEKYAGELADTLGRSLLNNEEIEAVTVAIHEMEAETSDFIPPSLISCLKKGVGFHHSGMHVRLKSLMETLYERKLLKVLYATSTFALGVNMPAKTVVFDELKKWNGRSFVHLSVREFMQMAGRAGRRGMDEEGFVVIKEDVSTFDDDQKYIEAYVKKCYEPLVSSFNLSFHSVLNLILGYDREVIEKFLRSSFFTFKAEKAKEIIRKRIEKLERMLEKIRRPEKNRGKINRKREEKVLKKIEILVREMERMEGGEEIMKRFDEKVEYLKTAGFITDDLVPLRRGLIMRNIQFEEILVTEIVISGMFEGLDKRETFGILVTLCHDLNPKIRVTDPLLKRYSKLLSSLKKIRRRDHIIRGEKIQGYPVTLSPNLFGAGWRWVNGEPLLDIVKYFSSESDIAGDLIVTFRRAKDLAGQLKLVYRDDPSTLSNLSSLIEDVTRDEMEVID